MIGNLINMDRQGFLDLCKKCHVAYIYAFGSSVNGNFRADSDVDVLVGVTPKDDMEAGGALIDLADGLENFFGRPVDLLTENSLRDRYLRREIEHTKKLIHDRSISQILV